MFTSERAKIFLSHVWSQHLQPCRIWQAACNEPKPAPNTAGIRPMTQGWLLHPADPFHTRLTLETEYLSNRMHFHGGSVEFTTKGNKVRMDFPGWPLPHSLTPQLPNPLGSQQGEWWGEKKRPCSLDYHRGQWGTGLVAEEVVCHISRLWWGKKQLAIPVDTKNFVFELNLREFAQTDSWQTSNPRHQRNLLNKFLGSLLGKWSWTNYY